MKIIYKRFILINLACASALSMIGCNDKKISENDIITNTVDTDKEIDILAVGDIMVHETQLKAQYNSSTNEYNFINNFKHVKKYIENADLALCNLETTFAGKEKGYSAYPSFNTPDALLDAIKDSGFDIITTINNHSNDKGKIGIERTYDLINEYGLTASGTRKNAEDKNYIIKDVEGIKLGILSYSYGEIINNIKRLNGLPISSSLTDVVNVFDYRDLHKTIQTLETDINKMKEENPDIIIFVPHWGNEYQTIPNSFQKSLSQELCNIGVDMIFGSHPHVVQPIETLTSNLDPNHKTTVVYSLGNFLSNQRKELISNSNYTEDGIMINVKIKKTNSGTEISEVSYIPTWVNRYQNSGKYTYEIIPIVNKEELESIDNLNLKDVKESYENTKKLINNENIPLYQE